MPSEFVKEVADVFAKDGPLSKVTANYTPRPSQIEFATVSYTHLTLPTKA